MGEVVARALHPLCLICNWRKGGRDSWDGRACKCGSTAPPIVEPDDWKSPGAAGPLPAWTAGKSIVETFAARRANAVQVLVLALEIPEDSDALAECAASAIRSALDLHNLAGWCVESSDIGEIVSLLRVGDAPQLHSFDADAACAVAWYLCELPEADSADVEDAIQWSRDGGRITLETIS